ncbi:MAG: hypothetical protein D6785_11385, partial [Planctomycetota bacterium]
SIGCITEERRVASTDYSLKGWKTDPKEIDTEKENINKLLKDFYKNPKDPGAAWRIGMYYFGNKEYVRAEYWFRYSLKNLKDIEKYPGRVKLYYLLAEAYMWQGKKEEARKYLEMTLAVKQPIEPYYVEFSEYKKAHFYLGKLDILDHRFKEAEEHFQKYLALGGDPALVEQEKQKIQVSQRKKQKKEILEKP